MRDAALYLPREILEQHIAGTGCSRCTATRHCLPRAAAGQSP
jgi:hypothetical protein